MNAYIRLSVMAVAVMAADSYDDNPNGCWISKFEPVNVVINSSLETVQYRGPTLSQ